MTSVSFIAGIMIGIVISMLVFAAPASCASVQAVLNTNGSDSTVVATANFVQTGSNVTATVRVTGLLGGTEVESATLKIRNGNTINALIGDPIIVGADGIIALIITILNTLLDSLFGSGVTLALGVGTEVTKGVTTLLLQSIPGLVILYGSIVKKKWAVNSAFMALYAFAAVVICWVAWAYKMAFGHKLLPFWGRAGASLGQDFLLSQSKLPASTHYFKGHQVVETAMIAPFYPTASMVWFQCVFAAITLILVAGSLLGRMNIRAWMMFVPLWLTFSYTVGAFSLWGGGFLFQWGVMDYSGGYVIHLSSGIAGFTAAYWVGPRLKKDRERFPPNNVLLMLCGAGILWMGWSGFNGGDPYAANTDSSIAVLNTHVCAATSLLMWTCLDVIVFGKPSVIGAVQGMITGLVCITPGAGLVQGWAAIVMGILSGSIPWCTMMIIHKKWKPLQAVDDTLGVFHTHAVAGLLGGLLTGIFAEPELCNLFLPVTNSKGAVYGGVGGAQVGKQLVGGLFIIGWNLVVTSIICVVIRFIVPLRMSEEELLIGDDAAHGEEAYALWGDGEKYDQTKHGYGFLTDETLHSDDRKSIGAAQVV